MPNIGCGVVGGLSTTSNLRNSSTCAGAACTQLCESELDHLPLLMSAMSFPNSRKVLYIFGHSLLVQRDDSKVSAQLADKAVTLRLRPDVVALFAWLLRSSFWICKTAHGTMMWFIFPSLICTLIVDSRLLLCSPEYDLSWHGHRGMGGLYQDGGELFDH